MSDNIHKPKYLTIESDNEISLEEKSDIEEYINQNIDSLIEDENVYDIESLIENLLRLDQDNIIEYIKKILNILRTSERSSIKELTKERKTKIENKIKNKELPAELFRIRVNIGQNKKTLKTIQKKITNASNNPKKLKSIKKQIKSFIIYETYKVINPHRIAGETKERNIINNKRLKRISIEDIKNKLSTNHDCNNQSIPKKNKTNNILEI